LGLSALVGKSVDPKNGFGSPAMVTTREVNS